MLHGQAFLMSWWVGVCFPIGSNTDWESKYAVSTQERAQDCRHQGGEGGSTTVHVCPTKS